MCSRAREHVQGPCGQEELGRAEEPWKCSVLVQLVSGALPDLICIWNLAGGGGLQETKMEAPGGWRAGRHELAQLRRCLGKHFSRCHIRVLGFDFQLHLGYGFQFVCTLAGSR